MNATDIVIEGGGEDCFGAGEEAFSVEILKLYPTSSVVWIGVKRKLVVFPKLSLKLQEDFGVTGHVIR